MSRFDGVEIEIVDDETVWQGFSTLRRVTFDYRGGAKPAHRSVWEVYVRGEAVAVLLYNRDRDVIITVAQFRLPAHLLGDHAFLTEVPAGGLEGEDPVEAARREILEETGYRAGDLQRLFTAFMSPGSFTEKVHFFFAPVGDADRVAEGGGLDAENEDIAVGEVTLDRAQRMVADGEIVDAKTIMLVQWAALNRDALNRDAMTEAR